MSAAARPAGEPQKLELEIFGLQFRLRAPIEEHERLVRTAKYVDNLMREHTGGQTAVDTTRLAIQTAFLIAKDYFQTVDEAMEGGTVPGGREVSRRVNGLVDQIDEALASLDSLPALDDQQWTGDAAEEAQAEEPVAEAEAADESEVETMVPDAASEDFIPEEVEEEPAPVSPPSRRRR